MRCLMFLLDQEDLGVLAVQFHLLHLEYLVGLVVLAVQPVLGDQLGPEHLEFLEYLVVLAVQLFL